MVYLRVHIKDLAYPTADLKQKFLKAIRALLAAQEKEELEIAEILQQMYGARDSLVAEHEALKDCI